MKSIFIVGKIGSGKDTMADYLVDRKGYQKESVAGPLKQIGEIFGFTHTQLYGTQEQKLEVNSMWGISGRHFLQKFGTEVCRDYLPKAIPEMKIGPNVWATLLKNKLIEVKTPIVVSDLRFPDTAEIIKPYGTIVKIIRPNYSNLDSSSSLHPSEVQQDLIEPDVVLINNGSLNDFYKRIDTIVKNLQE